MNRPSANKKKLIKKNLNSIGVRDGVGGQGQYRLGRGSIGWARAVSAVPLPKSDFQHIKNVYFDLEPQRECVNQVSLIFVKK